ncbi:cell surface glycoprotein related protein [Halocatena pleomorpha]|uniref:Cell surface glycoprotein related protein n=1 Tax=Halocatena pleomorpha TaxID=1785090 RepID=A0A3P3RKF6_9EURY|nr:cell surface glycoprotein related protein [Halocatena pleomorpha]RRJ33814.1 cell surface glycoprotein related protein [Halocatena pleomorpha]
MNTLQIVVSSVIGLVIVVAVVGTPAVGQAETPTVVFTQGDDSIRVTPLGDGTRSVEAFYDYRSPATEPEGQYSSYGTDDIQMDQVSQLFVYHGQSGLSLVFLHDEHSNTTGGGAVITADISGLPESGDWVVEDDTYNNRDDVFRHSRRSSHIEWLMNGHRTDGAAFRGLEETNDTITVAMRFNENSENYPWEEWEGRPEQNEIKRWLVRSGTGEMTELAMDEPVEIRMASDNRTEPTTETPDENTPLVNSHPPTHRSSPDTTGSSGVTGGGFGVVQAIVALVALMMFVLGRDDD